MCHINWMIMCADLPRNISALNPHSRKKLEPRWWHIVVWQRISKLVRFVWLPQTNTADKITRLPWIINDWIFLRNVSLSGNMTRSLGLLYSYKQNHATNFVTNNKSHKIDLSPAYAAAYKFILNCITKTQSLSEKKLQDPLWWYNWRIISGYDYLLKKCNFGFCQYVVGVETDWTTTSGRLL